LHFFRCPAFKKFRTRFKKDCARTLLIPDKDFKWPKKNVREGRVWLSTGPNIIISFNHKEKV